MTSQTLREARKYEEASEKNDKERGTPGFPFVYTYWLDE